MTYHVGFVAQERVENAEDCRALDLLLVLTRLLTATELAFPYQQKLSAGKFNYGIKKLRAAPSILSSITEELAARKRLDEDWFISSKTAQVRAHMTR